MKRILFVILPLLVLASCKKDRFVNCEHKVDGTYSGDKITYTDNDTLYADSDDLLVKLKSGKVLIEYKGSKSNKMEVDNCVAGYSTQVDASDDQYSIVSFEFHADSLYYTLDKYISNELDEEVHYFLTKNK